MGFQTGVQRLRFGCADIQSKNIGLSQIKTRGVDVTQSLAHVCGLGVQIDKTSQITIGVRRKHPGIEAVRRIWFMRRQRADLSVGWPPNDENNGSGYP